LQEELLEHMSDNNQTVKTSWSSVQVYTLSAICLLIGVTMGYLFRGSTAPKAPSASTTAAVQTPTAGGIDASAPQSPEAMKRMAEKQVTPLLEQLKSNPNDADTLAQVAHYYIAAGQFPDAVTYYEKAVAIKPTAESLTQLAGAYYYSGSTDKSVDALNRALQVDPKYPNALYDLGMLKWKVQGDAKGAVECWQRLLKTNPDHPRRAEVEKMIARAKEHAKMPAGTKTDKPAM
jgi:cytochrome c-type biogenesis protein CcmH/NrfG